MNGFSHVRWSDSSSDMVMVPSGELGVAVVRFFVMIVVALCIIHRSFLAVTEKRTLKVN